MNGLDLMDELWEKTSLLDTAITQLGKRGRTYAQAEHDYKVALAKRIMEARASGIPATICQDVCRGDPTIAKLRFERDIAEVSYDAAREAINGYKLQIRILDAQIEREWGRASAN